MDRGGFGRPVFWFAMNTMLAEPEEHPHSAVRLGASGISKSYGAVRANRDITLSVKPREIHAVVGENGAGKSTLMRILQGMEQPELGIDCRR